MNLLENGRGSSTIATTSLDWKAEVVFAWEELLRVVTGQREERS